jgi:hypothetical protein
MSKSTQLGPLDEDQELILAVYSFYSNEAEHTYLQYTAACALIYFLTNREKDKMFNYELNELLVYDYKDSRRYIWEAKKFMNDINVLRDHKFLIRARSRSKTYRDVNAHQCSNEGHKFLKKLQNESVDFKRKVEKTRDLLSCCKGHLYEVVLEKEGPELVCRENAKECIRLERIEGFLKDLCFDEDVTKKNDQGCVNLLYEPYFI